MRRVATFLSALCLALALAGAVHAQPPPGLQRIEKINIFKGDTLPGKCNPGDVYLRSTDVQICNADGLGLTKVYTTDNPPTSVPSGPAGGDLSGTYPNPSVSKVNGNTPGGTCTNQVATGTDTSGRPNCGTVPNAALVNSSTTVNSQPCALGATCTVTAVPSGSAGGDLGGTFPNPTVTNLSNVANNSLPNSGLVNSSTSVNGQTCALGSTCTVQGAPNGSAGGDLAGSYPSPTVSNLSNVTNGSLANSGLAHSSSTVNGQTCTLGSSCTVSLVGILAESGNLSTLGSAVVRYMGPAGLQAGEPNTQYVMPRAATLRNLYVVITGAMSTSALTVTVTSCTPSSGACSGSLSTIQVVIAASSPAGVYSDTSHTLSVSAGDFVGIKLSEASGASSGGIGGVSVEMDF